MKYKNRDLRSVVSKINKGVGFPCTLNGRPSWDTISRAVHHFVPEQKHTDISERFGTLWRRLARQFIDDYFEPEYNSLKHGMRATVGGFSVAVGRETTYGTPPSPENMHTIGGSEHGSSFWMPPRKVDRFGFTFELSKNVTRAWVPREFVCALPLIGMSIGNVAGAALIESGVSPATVRFEWPSDADAYEAPWRELASIGSIGSGRTTDLHGWREPTGKDILQKYKHRR